MSTGTITHLGLGSGLDLQTMLDTQREADEAIAALKLDEVETQTTVKEELNSVLNQLLTMKTSSLNLSLTSNYVYRSATVSDTDIVTATAQDSTETGSHSIETTRLASASSYISEAYSSESDSIYVPTVRESINGFTADATVLAEDATLEISYGNEDDPETFTITGTTDGLTADELVAAINVDTANQDDEGNALVTASTYEDDDGNIYIRIEAASGGTDEDSRVSVTGLDGVTGFTAPVSEFSFSLGEEGETYSISVPAETTLEGLAERINEDEDNPGVTASVINTGTGDNTYQLVLEADDSGNDSRITIITEPSGLTMSEKNGSGYTMTGDTAIDFENGVTISDGIDDANNTIVFQEDDGDELTAEIAAGTYETADELAEAVEIALENASKSDGSEKDYQVYIDSDTGKMVIAESGTLDELTINWGDANSTASGQLGFSETQTITPADSSLNAEVIVDGVSYQRQENTTLTDIIDGVTLSLYSTGTTTLSIENNTTTVEDEISSLVETYNALITEIDENDDYDADDDTWGTLSQSSTARTLKLALQSLFSTTVDTGGSITSLLDIGIEFESDGTITLDEDELSEQLSDNYEEIMDLLLGTDTVTGLADTLNDELGNYALSDGYINGEIDGIDEQITRLEESYEQEIERLEKKYEIMADQYTALDTYLAEIETLQSYITTMLSDSDDE